MKPEEAIELITKPMYIQGMRQGKTAYREAMAEAVKALEKQITKNPPAYRLTARIEDKVFYTQGHYELTTAGEMTDAQIRECLKKLAFYEDWSELE